MNDGGDVPDPANGGFYGQPSLAGLLDAVREWLDGVRAHGGGPTLRFDARVAANILAIAGRELALGDAHAAAHRERLASLGVADDAELVELIRSGAADDRWHEIAGVLADDVRDRLAVNDPRYANARPDNTPGFSSQSRVRNGPELR